MSAWFVAFRVTTPPFVPQELLTLPIVFVAVEALPATSSISELLAIVAPVRLMTASVLHTKKAGPLE